MRQPDLDFSDNMRTAQLAHQQRDYNLAIGHWQAAQTLAPGPLDNGRAVRGQASSMIYRDGPTNDALVLAESAVRTHQDLGSATPEDYGVIRQIPESVRVWGAAWLLRGIQTDQKDRNRYGLARALRIFRGGDGAIDQMRQWRGPDSMPDQHEINWWPRRAIAEALAPDGNRQDARALARRALQTSGYSEIHDLPTRANISPEYAGRANLRARVRALGARAVVELTTPQPSARRRAALLIASRII